MQKDGMNINVAWNQLKMKDVVRNIVNWKERNYTTV